MAIIIKIRSRGEEIEKVLLKARQTIDGNIIIHDHPEMNLMILAKQKKIVSLPKEELDDELYDSQKRLFDFLTHRGVIKYDSVQAGKLIMAMEASYPETDKGDKIQYLLYAISDFIEKELPFYRNQEEYEKEMEKKLLEPEPDEFTELDPDKYHSEKKGSLRPQMRPYGISTIYRI